MQTTVLNYRIIVEPDERTGTNESCFTAYCPTLGVADGGDTIEEALANVRGAIEAYVESLVEDGLLVPVDKPEESIIAATQVKVHGAIQFA
ncbi:type II toxin-antitoxin system HicB family antitoxin [Candidatus Gottesmanbacteria bacterium]|nr:type II toxin-antitoxin system HicB family antitoxin [Candidatus Gottesmanbacteria bacterium]